MPKTVPLPAPIVVEPGACVTGKVAALAPLIWIVGVPVSVRGPVPAFSIWNVRVIVPPVTAADPKVSTVCG